jgi:hypothetical protein
MLKYHGIRAQLFIQSVRLFIAAFRAEREIIPRGIKKHSFDNFVLCFSGVLHIHKLCIDSRNFYELFFHHILILHRLRCFKT